MPKKHPEQKLILTTGIDKEGNISVKMEFVPKMPDTKEAFLALPEAKRGIVAVTDQYARQIDMITKNLMGMANAVELPELREAVSEHDSGGEAQALLSAPVPTEKEIEK